VNAFASLAATHLDTEGTGDPFAKMGITVRNTAKRQCTLSVCFFRHILYKTYTKTYPMYNKMSWPLALYFDGECPPCAREIKYLHGPIESLRIPFSLTASW